MLLLVSGLVYLMLILIIPSVRIQTDDEEIRGIFIICDVLFCIQFHERQRVKCKNHGYQMRFRAVPHLRQSP